MSLLAPSRDVLGRGAGVPALCLPLRGAPACAKLRRATATWEVRWEVQAPGAGAAAAAGNLVVGVGVGRGVVVAAAAAAAVTVGAGVGDRSTDHDDGAAALAGPRQGRARACRLWAAHLGNPSRAWTYLTSPQTIILHSTVVHSYGERCFGAGAPPPPALLPKPNNRAGRPSPGVGCHAIMS